MLDVLLGARRRHSDHAQTVGSMWDYRVKRIKRKAERIQRAKEK